MDTIIFVLMIALGIAICVAIREYKRAKFCKAMWKETGEQSREQADELKKKDVQIDRLLKEIAKLGHSILLYEKKMREEETKGA